MSSPFPYRTYVCGRASEPPKMDGDLDSGPWDRALWSTPFVDIEGDIRLVPRFRTRMKMLWDDDCLYIGAEMEEPHVWGTLVEHDSVIFQDNDFEVFIDPDGDGCLYGELEINALNTTWDLMLVRSYRGGGPAINGWEIAGLTSKVTVRGTLNDASDIDNGWVLEIAIPFSALKELGGIPKVGAQWRINFSRVEWEIDIVDGNYVKVPNRSEDNWVWSPMGVIDMHRPERWGVLQFGEHGSETVVPLAGFEERILLAEVWEHQRDYRSAHGRYAGSGQELGMVINGLTIESNPNQFEASIGSESVNQELRFSGNRMVHPGPAGSE